MRMLNERARHEPLPVAIFQRAIARMFESECAYGDLSLGSIAAALKAKQ